MSYSYLGHFKHLHLLTALEDAETESLADAALLI